MGVIRRHASLALIAAAAIAVLLAFSLGPGSAPPVYDGVCIANPYQYFSPPPGAPTTPATSGKHDIPVRSGTVPGSIVMTQEFPAQAQLTTDDGTLVPPAGAATVHLRIDPVAPPSVQPTDGSIDGNVYSISATGDQGGVVSVDPQKPATVTLRTTSATGQTEVIEHFDGTRWTKLATQPAASCAFYFTASTATLGDFVLVVPSSSASSTGGGGGESGGGGPLLLILAVAALLVAVTAGVSLVVARRRRQAAQRRRGRGRRR